MRGQGGWARVVFVVYGFPMLVLSFLECLTSQPVYVSVFRLTKGILAGSLEVILAQKVNYRFGKKIEQRYFAQMIE